jgi:uncharacterized protein YfaA (DUF2138 family)
MLKKKKVIKTNYKVALLANQIEKQLQKKIDIFIPSSYKVNQLKLYNGDRYVFVKSKDRIITCVVLRELMKVVEPIADAHCTGAVCSGVTLIEGEDDGKKTWFTAFYVLINKL